MPETAERPRGLWVCFEGPDGAGKSSLADEFVRQLEFGGVAHLPSPSSGHVGRFIRSTLAEAGPNWVFPEARQALFAGDIINTYFRNVVPALLNGSIVVSDRWIMSTLAYLHATMALQNSGRNGSDAAQGLWEYYVALTEGMGPDVTYHVDTALPIRMKRIGERRAEVYETRGFQLAVDDAYRALRKTPSFYDHGLDLHLPVSGVVPVEDTARRLHREIKRFGDPPVLPLHPGLFNRIAKDGGIDDV